MPNVTLGEMTWTEARDFLKGVDVAIIPVGSTEQHGPHMAEYADIIIASHLARKVAERLYPMVIVGPDMPVGISFHHMKYAGTLTLRESTMIDYVYDVANSLKFHGIKFVIFLNTHYGNQSPLSIGCNKIRLELGIRAITIFADIFMQESSSEEVDEGQLYGHGGEAQTSIVMKIRPDSVRRDKLKRTESFLMDPKKFRLFLAADDQFPIYDQASKDGLDFSSPENASPEKGEKKLEFMITEISKLVEDLIRTYR